MNQHKADLRRLAEANGFFAIRFTPWGTRPRGLAELNLASRVTEEFTTKSALSKIFPIPNVQRAPGDLSRHDLAQALVYPSRIGPVLWSYPVNDSRLPVIAASGFDPMFVTNTRSVAGATVFKFAKRKSEEGFHVLMVFGNPRLESVNIFSPRDRIGADLDATWELVTITSAYRKLYAL